MPESSARRRWRFRNMRQISSKYREVVLCGILALLFVLTALPQSIYGAASKYPTEFIAWLVEKSASPVMSEIEKKKLCGKTIAVTMIIQRDEKPFESLDTRLPEGKIIEDLLENYLSRSKCLRLVTRDYGKINQIWLREYDNLVKGNESNIGELSSADYFFTGKYWEENGRLYLQVEVWNKNNGVIETKKVESAGVFEWRYHVWIKFGLFVFMALIILALLFYRKKKRFEIKRKKELEEILLKETGDAEQLQITIDNALSARDTAVLKKLNALPVSNGIRLLLSPMSTAVGMINVLCADSAVMGRGDVDFKVSHPAVSREHVRINLEQGVYHIVDLKSSKGTFIKEERAGNVSLRDGDNLDIRLGDSSVVEAKVVPVSALLLHVKSAAIEAGTLYVLMFERAALPEPAGIDLIFRDGLFFIKSDAVGLQDADGLEIKSSDFVYLKPKDRLVKDGTILWEVRFK
jgi:hypothetical protein